MTCEEASHFFSELRRLGSHSENYLVPVRRTRYNRTRTVEKLSARLQQFIFSTPLSLLSKFAETFDPALRDAGFYQVQVTLESTFASLVRPAALNQQDFPHFCQSFGCSSFIIKE